MPIALEALNEIILILTLAPLQALHKWQLILVNYILPHSTMYLMCEHK